MLKAEMMGTEGKEFKAREEHMQRASKWRKQNMQ
jgi:hypothetical protein